MQRADLVIIGAGIVGLATAFQIARARPALRLVILDKEATLASHQTGRNSGVIHSGIYYKPGSMKAATCRRGKALLEAFCREHDVPFETCGKVIVAVDEHELPSLSRIHERGIANGVRCEVIDAPRLHELEPSVAGVRAIHVPESGIVDYVRMCERLADQIRQSGGQVRLGEMVVGFDRRPSTTVVRTTLSDVEARLVINCAGLHCDRIASREGARPAAKIVPFRGEYFELVPGAEALCRNLIYPVPDPSFPFLGVHFTRMVRGGVECGPNAVLAFAREGYTLGTLDPGDLLETLTYAGFWRMARKHWRTGMGEMWRSISKAAFVRALQRLIPAIEESHLVPAPAGVRAQSLLPDGSMVDDFLIEETDQGVHVLNAPSPAATASLAIGEHVAGRALTRVG
ncbi:MAG: L-2-hydroxyglutarate oxidase [Phycisphaerales bacterium]|nr:L-2-hydroxyglutarate oxidase [Phycisphaerales bacterium]